MSDSKKLKDGETERNRVRKLNEKIAELEARIAELEARIAALEPAVP